MNKTTGKTISIAQNAPDNIRCLAAQRVLYSYAKNILSLQVFLSVIFVICISFVSLKYDIQAFFSIYCVTITVFDILFLNNIMNRYKDMAAQAQEVFDTKVFGIEWNNLIDKVDSEIIYRYSERYRKKEPNFDSLKDWYSTNIAEVMSEKAILVCQRSNCYYDSSLRKNFKNITSSMSLSAGFLILIFSSINGININNLFTTILLPLLPIITFYILRYRENQTALITLSRMYQFVCKAWTDSLSERNDSVKNLARQVQDRIYHNRKDSPLVFDWYYALVRNKHESEMNYSVEQLVDEYKDNNRI